MEHDSFIQINANNILDKLFNKYKLNNRNIYTIIRYADLLCEKMIKNKHINKSDEQNINLIKIKSFNLHPIYIENIIILSIIQQIIIFFLFLILNIQIFISNLIQVKFSQN